MRYNDETEMFETTYKVSVYMPLTVNQVKPLVDGISEALLALKNSPDIGKQINDTLEFLFCAPKLNPLPDEHSESVLDYTLNLCEETEADLQQVVDDLDQVIQRSYPQDALMHGITVNESSTRPTSVWLDKVTCNTFDRIRDLNQKTGPKM